MSKIWRSAGRISLFNCHVIGLLDPADTTKLFILLPLVRLNFVRILDMTLDVGQSIAGQIADVRSALKKLQRLDGHWVFEIEADATISAEYVMLQHFLGETGGEEERKVAAYLRDTQASHGGWPLFAGGGFDLSASVKAYYALKLAGEDSEGAEMRRAREEILRHGGAAKANVFTRISLALFGQVPWRAVPVMPIEIMLQAPRSPFHLSKISYWSRTVLIPLLILMALKPKARNPRGVDIRVGFQPIANV